MMRTIIIFSFSILLLSLEALSQNLNYQWAFKIEGNKTYITDIKIDALGNSIVYGGFSSTVDFDPGSATQNITSIGAEDVFIAKYDPYGALVWVKDIGGASKAQSSKIQLDQMGNIYSVGTFSTTLDLDPSNSTYIINSNGGYDIFVAKYDNNGSFLWGKNFGSVSDDFGNAITLDVSNNAYITGAGNSNFIKLDVNGNTVWNKTIIGADGICISIGHQNELYITGVFGSTATFDINTNTTYSVTCPIAYCQNLFYAKYDTAGNYSWVNSNLGYFTYYSLCSITDSTGNLYITGGFGGTVDFDPTASVDTLRSNRVVDVYVAKYSNSGHLLWAKSFGGFADDSGSGIAFDSQHNLYIIGSFINTVDFDPTAAVDSISTGDGLGPEDVFITKYDTSGNYNWAKKLGGRLNDFGSGVIINSNDDIFLYGTFQDTVDFDFSTSVSNLIANNNYQSNFISKYSLLTTGIKEEQFNNHIALYPNPSNGTFYINNQDLYHENYTVIIYNMSGEQVYKHSYTNEGKQQINTSFGNGIYMLQIIDNLGKINYKEKFVIQK